MRSHSERDTGHDLRRRGHSYQLVCYNFSSTRRCFVIRMLYVVSVCVCQMQINSLTYLLIVEQVFISGR